MSCDYKLYDTIVAEVLKRLIDSDDDEIYISYIKDEPLDEFMLQMAIYATGMSFKKLVINCGLFDRLYLKFKKKIKFKYTREQKDPMFDLLYEIAGQHSVNMQIYNKIYNEYYRSVK